MATLHGYAKEIGGDQANEVMSLFKQEAQEYMKQNGRLYPVGHPLHESDYMPLAESDLAIVRSNVQRKLDMFSGMRARAVLDSTATPGSGNAMDGAATDPNRGTGLRDKDSRRARVEQALRRNLAHGSGESISNA